MKYLSILTPCALAISALLVGCGGGEGDNGSSNGSSNGNTSESLSTPSQALNDEMINEVSTAELVAPEGFNFSTDYQVDVSLMVSEPAGALGYISLYIEFDAASGRPDYASRIVLSTLDNQNSFNHSMRLPNHVNQVWAEVWYRDAPTKPLKQMLTVSNGVINETL